MNKKPYLIRRYLRDRKTGWPLVREYVVHSVREPKIDTQAGTVSVVTVGSSLSSLANKSLKDWTSPYSPEELKRAGITAK